MATMTVRVTNTRFESTSTGEFDTLDDAFREGVLAGLEIAAGEIRDGSSSTIVQVSVDLVGRGDAARGAVAVQYERFSDALASDRDHGLIVPGSPE